MSQQTQHKEIHPVHEKVMISLYELQNIINTVTKMTFPTLYKQTMPENALTLMASSTGNAEKNHKMNPATDAVIVKYF